MLLAAGIRINRFGEGSRATAVTACLVQGVQCDLCLALRVESVVQAGPTSGAWEFPQGETPVYAGL